MSDISKPSASDRLKALRKRVLDRLANKRSHEHHQEAQAHPTTKDMWDTAAACRAVRAKKDSAESYAFTGADTIQHEGSPSGSSTFAEGDAGERRNASANKTHVSSLGGHPTHGDSSLEILQESGILAQRSHSLTGNGALSMNSKGTHSFSVHHRKDQACADTIASAQRPKRSATPEFAIEAPSKVARM